MPYQPGKVSVGNVSVGSEIHKKKKNLFHMLHLDLESANQFRWIIAKNDEF